MNLTVTGKLAALLLLVRTTLLKRQQAWAAYAVRFASDIGLDFLTYGVIFSGLILQLSPDGDHVCVHSGLCDLCI